MADLTDAQKKRQQSRQKRRGGSEEPQPPQTMAEFMAQKRVE